MEHHEESSRFFLPQRLRARPTFLRVGFLVGLIVLVGLFFAAIDLSPDLSTMRVGVLSGPEGGEDYALASRLARAAHKRNGTVVNVVTAGMAANLAALSKNDRSDKAEFALALDGLEYPGTENLELVARIPATRTLFILGPAADSIHSIADLAGMRIGIGTEFSATSLLAKEILGSAPLKGLNVTLSEHPLAEQVDKLRRHELDLGFFLVADDSPLIDQAVRDGLQIASLDNAEALASWLPSLRVSTLYPGQVDLVLGLPRTAKKTFQLDMLMLTNRHVSRSKKVEMLGLMDTAFKGFVDLNRNTENHTGLAEVADLRPFVQNGGPSVLDEYAPRLLDFMPPANLLHYVVVVSLLLNAMTLWHRFRLWRIDHQRIHLEDRALAFFGRNHTIMEISLLTPKPGDFDGERRRMLDVLIDETQTLRQRIRRYSVAMIVPMGSEMYYRSQESLVDGQLQALRRFRDRLNRLGKGAEQAD
jgi:hypothetical protein